MRCPGQDPRFWTPADIADVACRQCGATVEFFRDDAFRRCPRCGGRIANPLVNLGCAQWCSQAARCLGTEPGSASGAAQVPLMDRLIAAAREELGDDARVRHALRVLARSLELLRDEGGDPRVATAAALLHPLEDPHQGGHAGPGAGPEPVAEPATLARRVLARVDVDPQTVGAVCGVLAELRTGADPASLEATIVRDAELLTELPHRHASPHDRQVLCIIDRTFRTRTGRELARALAVVHGDPQDGGPVQE